MTQTGNGNQGESGGSRSRTYSAAEFQTLARKRVEEALGARAIPGTEMNGILGPFSDGKAYPTAIYEIKLLDLDPEETSYVELVIPRKNSPGGSPAANSLEELVRFLQNRPVKVRGDVQTNTFNGRIKPGPESCNAGVEPRLAEKSDEKSVGRFNVAWPGREEACIARNNIVHEREIYSS